MSKIQKSGLCIIMLIVIILLSSLVSGIGVLPASKQLLSDSKESFQLKIINNDKEEFDIYLDVQGDLANYISLGSKHVKFGKDKDMERIDVQVNIPPGLNLKEGNHENHIMIRQESKQTSQIGATITLDFKVNIMVPYSDEALEINLLASNFKKGEKNNFVIEAKNMGSKDINQAIPTIDIYSPANDKIETITVNKVNIPKGQKVLIDIPWTPELPNGKYYSKGFVIYGDRTADSEKQFVIGSPDINIDTISTYSFKLGGIANLDIIISSNWVSAITDIFADVDLLKGTTTVYTTKTASKEISSLGKTNLPVYLDTTGLEPGKYNLVVNLHFLNLIKTESFELFLEQDKISLLQGSGRVVDDVKGEGGSGTILLTILVIVLVIMNGFIIYKFVIKKKNKG